MQKINEWIRVQVYRQGFQFSIETPSNYIKYNLTPISLFKFEYKKIAFLKNGRIDL